MPYTTYTDEALFCRVQADDDKAFAELYDRYWEKLIARAVAQLCSVHDAEDTLHDVFVSLWNRRKKIVLQHSFHTYIAAMLKYEIIGRLAERKKKSAGALGEEQVQLADDSTSAHLDFRELQQRLELSVQRLPEKCQLVFRLSREQGLKGNEIARMLHISPKTVENHINHALRAIRSSIDSLLSFLF